MSDFTDEQRTYCNANYDYHRDKDGFSCAEAGELAWADLVSRYPAVANKRPDVLRWELPRSEE